jgi:peroxiredoxin
MYLKVCLPLFIMMAFVLTAFTTNAPQVEQPEFLKEGEKAPNFVTKDVMGNKINLKKMLKKSNVLLTFLRPAWCPICNARTYELIQNYEAMKAQGIEVIAVYPSSEKELQSYVEELDIPFPIISDPDGELYRLYKVERSREKFEMAFTEKKALKYIQDGKDLYEKYDNDYGGIQEVAVPIIPADFILTQKDSKIVTAYYGAYLGDHMDVKEIKVADSNTQATSRF